MDSVELSKSYSPQKVEDFWSQQWIEAGLFASTPDSRQPYTIVIPPPNVTGSLHMGHALNNTLQDIIIRFQRLSGKNTRWIPGTDHGGIATQNVVEKLLLAEGKTRDSLGREKFLEKMWQWRNESGDMILHQLKKLGCALDWSAVRFTMDEVCSRAVIFAFVELYRRGLIYRGERLVNWCPRCQTALADIEVEHHQEIGQLWYIKYPRPGARDEFIVVATTRPETMLGDTAVAVHPDDKRYKNLVGQKVLLPLLERPIPIISDLAVDMAFGSGAVKVTPAHDEVDFAIGERHNLEKISVIDSTGKITAAGKQYAGLDRYLARKKILQDLERQNLLLKSVPHPHAVGHCYRCDTVIEPRLSEQWFLKVKDMSRRAIEVVKNGQIKFYPSSWAKPYCDWLQNLHDWCISRQIWWGHRIPVYYCPKGCPPVVAEKRPERCPHCGSDNLKQDEDVLDTWFSSALWPLAVFGWPDKKLEYYFPTSVLVTGHEILYLWVARMVQMSLEFTNQVPFREVFIHGIVRDKSGKKMSKSLGNVIDPLDIMKQYGTDALRFSLAASAAPGRDMQLSNDSFVGARNFANKIWNVARYILLNRFGNELKLEQLLNERWSAQTISSRWIWARYKSAVENTTRAFARYDIDLAARLIYDFVWSEFCDWYIELSKIEINAGDDQQKEIIYNNLREIFFGILRLLHPIMPYLTEDLSQYFGRKEKFLLNEKWPTIRAIPLDTEAINKIVTWQEIITAIRRIRNEFKIEQRLPIGVFIKPRDGSAQMIIDAGKSYLSRLATIKEIKLDLTASRPDSSAVAVVKSGEIFVPLAGLIDIAREKQRLEKELADLAREKEIVVSKLTNPEFVSKAPTSEVERVKNKSAELDWKIEHLKNNLSYLR